MSYTGTKVRLFFEWENFCAFLRGGIFLTFLKFLIFLNMFS